MAHTLSRLLTTFALVASAGVLSVVACTRTTDRVVEPPGGADASTTPAVGDSGTSPLGPIADPVQLEPREDFRLVRAPEFGIARTVQLVNLSTDSRADGLGGSGAGGAGGYGGSDRRPVAAGGNYY